MRQILNEKFYDASDFELKFLQRVRFCIKIFTTGQILKKNKFLESMILKKKIIFKSTILMKKFIFKKHDFENKLHSKNHVLSHFTP